MVTTLNYNALLIFPDVDEELQRATRLMVDNQGAIALAKNPVFHRKTMHITVDYHHM